MTGERRYGYEYRILDLRIWKSILRLSVPDVSLAICGLSWSFKREVENMAFRLLCYGADRDHEHGGAAARIVPRVESMDYMPAVLWHICAGIREKYGGVS